MSRLLLVGDPTFLALWPFEATWRLALSTEQLGQGPDWPALGNDDLVLYQEGLLAMLSVAQQKALKKTARWVEVPMPPEEGATNADENTPGSR